MRHAESRTFRVLTIVLSLLLCGLLIEAICQVYAFYLRSVWTVVKEDPRHVYQASERDGLAYELRPNIELKYDGKTLRTNALGMRGPMHDPLAAGGILLAGDSVVFGTGYSEEEVLSALIGRELRSRGVEKHIYNAGVPGYNTKETVINVVSRLDAIATEQIIYLLNLNDFLCRGSIREGADNGLYRMYKQPMIKAPWMLGKVIYRYKKGGEPTSIEWYEWLYADAAPVLDAIRKLGQELTGRGIRFVVAILPAGVGYTGGVYELQWIHDDIRRNVAENAEVWDLAPVLLNGNEGLFTNTDHLTIEGNQVVAEIMSRNIALEIIRN